MKAYQVKEYNDNASFVETELDKPSIQPGHVLVKVRATSLNPVDHKILTGDVGFNPDLPAVLHMDVSGVVVEIGQGINQFNIGDEVYGCAGGLQGNNGKLEGALADYMLVDAQLIAHKPKTLGLIEAAALPLVSITAWEGLFDRANIQKNDHVLIHAGTGGVGHIAVQLAKQHGAKVATTISSEEKSKMAQQLGVDEVINYKKESVANYVERLTQNKGFDVVYDTLGESNLDRSLEAARINGQVISTVGVNTHDLSPMHVKGLTLHLVFMLLPMITGIGRSHHGHILAQIAKMVDEGNIVPLIHEKRFLFNQVNQAHALFASGQHVGKILLENDS